MSTLREQVAIYELSLIQAALGEHNQNRRKAAKALGISLRTLFYKLRDVDTPPIPRACVQRHGSPEAAALFEKHFPSTHSAAPERDPRAVLLDDWWPGKIDAHCAHCSRALPVEKGAMMTGGECSTVIPGTCPFCGLPTMRMVSS